MREINGEIRNSVFCSTPLYGEAVGEAAKRLHLRLLRRHDRRWDLVGVPGCCQGFHIKMKKGLGWPPSYHHFVFDVILRYLLLRRSWNLYKFMNIMKVLKRLLQSGHLMARNRHLLWTWNRPRILRLLRAQDGASEGELWPRLGAAAPRGALLPDLRLGGADPRRWKGMLI